MGRLEATAAIVTGAGSGIGRACAVRFAEEGAGVVVTGRRADALDETRRLVIEAGGSCVTVPGDVSARAAREAAVAAAMDGWGRIDVLVNNAATDHEATFLDVPLAEWERVLAVNLTAPFALSQLVGRQMVAGGAGGSMVHVSSIAAHAVDGPFVPYDTSKAALLALSRSIAVDLAPHGVRSNCVSPGATRTDLMVGVTGPKMAEYMATSFERVPLRRILDPEEVAAACVFLASAESSGVTGTELVVDGGLTAQHFIGETLPEFDE